MNELGLNSKAPSCHEDYLPVCIYANRVNWGIWCARGYINMYAVYIIWLVSAVFHHLPTLDEFGMNVKADISIILSVFSATFVVRGYDQSYEPMGVHFQLGAGFECHFVVYLVSAFRDSHKHVLDCYTGCIMSIFTASSFCYLVTELFCFVQVIGLLNALHYTAVSMKKVSPFLFVPGAGPREIWSAIAVNSMSVAVACR